MKNNNLIIILIVLFLGSCTINDNREDNNYTGDEQTYFTEISLEKDAVVSSSSNTIITVEVGSTINTSSDRTYTISIDESSTAIEDVDYVLDSNLVTIPSGSNVGYLKINTLFATMQDYSKLILNLIDNGSPVSDFKNQMTVILSKQCDASYMSSLSSATNYTVFTTYGFHDFLADFPTSTLTNVHLVELGNNTFQVNDFSGGLYGVGGPYDTAYGTGSVDNTLTFTDECNKIVWENQTDPWGDINPDNGANSIDPTTGVITISWTCTGYGENGVSVYTPQ